MTDSGPPRRLSSAAPKRLVSAAIALATFVAFLPVLRNGFVDWDDRENLLLNPFYRGFAAEHLRWMWTTPKMGLFIPVTWMSYACDFALWGMNPAGYHLTSLVLHSLNAALFFVLIRRLLAGPRPAAESPSSRRIDGAAAASALLFSLHPLRVESVAWATERRDVLGGFFLLLTLLAWLRSGDETDPARARRWAAASWALYALSLLSKPNGMTLPAVLWILGRARPRPRGLSEIRELLPFAALAVPAAALAAWTQVQAGAAAPLSRVGVLERAGLLCNSLGFYLQKTLVPSGLSPFYPLPSRLDARLAWSAAVVAAGTAFLLRTRRARPETAAAFAAYALLVLPTSGIFQSGTQSVADRYSYLPALALSVAAAFALVRTAERLDPRAARSAAAAASLGLAVLAGLTWRQTLIWRDSRSLWTAVVEREPGAAMGHNGLGITYGEAGQWDAAIREFSTARTLSPSSVGARLNLEHALEMKRRAAREAPSGSARQGNRP